MPNATDFQLHIFAALAQEERRLISERTKAALAEAKRRGKILGANGRNLAAENRNAADELASQLRTYLDTGLMRQTYSEIARQVNAAGITTVTGRKFYPQTVKNYVRRFDPHRYIR
jgi:DNA invertase Pin-like site-specific DNA recombinase